MFLRCLSFLPASFSEWEVRTDSTSSTVLLLTLAGQCNDATPRVWRCFTWRTIQIHFTFKAPQKLILNQGKVLTIRSSLRSWVPFSLRRMLARYPSHTDTSSPQCVFRKSWINREKTVMAVSGRLNKLFPLWIPTETLQMKNSNLSLFDVVTVPQLKKSLHSSTDNFQG